MFCNKNNINWNEHDKLRELVKARVKEKRYIHTLGVESESVKLAEIFGCGAELVKKIKSAALLHDITKEQSREEQLEICVKYKIKLNGNDKRIYQGWHAATGAYVARREFGADDIIFNAIYNHTYGAVYKKFDLAGKIIYLADWIEPNRDDANCLAVREYFYKNLENHEDKYRALDGSILFAADAAFKLVIENNLIMHKRAVKCRNSFIINK